MAINFDEIQDGSVLTALKTVYEQGYENGRANATEISYQNGLDDAWNVARKITTWPNRELINSDEFDLDPGENIFTKYSVNEAMKKLKAFEERKKMEKMLKLHVGDEIQFIDGIESFKAVVIDEAEEPGVWLVFTENGCIEALDENLLVKTGRHSGLVDKLLNELRSNSEI